MLRIKAKVLIKVHHTLCGLSLKYSKYMLPPQGLCTCCALPGTLFPEVHMLFSFSSWGSFSNYSIPIAFSLGLSPLHSMAFPHRTYPAPFIYISCPFSVTCFPMSDANKETKSNYLTPTLCSGPKPKGRYEHTGVRSVRSFQSS